MEYRVLDQDGPKSIAITFETEEELDDWRWIHRVNPFSYGSHRNYTDPEDLEVGEEYEFNYLHVGYFYQYTEEHKYEYLKDPIQEVVERNEDASGEITREDKETIVTYKGFPDIQLERTDDGLEYTLVESKSIDESQVPEDNYPHTRKGVENEINCEMYKDYDAS